MIEIFLDPDRQPLDLRLPLHQAIRNVLQRHARQIRSCECVRPKLRVYLADTWQVGGLQIRRIETCCDRRMAAAVDGLPGVSRSQQRRRRDLG